MNYYGIKYPDDDPLNSGRIYWITSSEHNSWIEFFKDNANRAPIATAIRAYESIGYKCVELEIKEK
jgi:hypothetical protein